MTVLKCIQFESTSEIKGSKLSPDVKFREAVIDTQIFNPRGKSFVQPQMSPPFLENTKLFRSVT